MDHLAMRFREGRISIVDFDELFDWLSSDPDVPGMVAHGTEVE
jgi:hypothetical protein